MIRIVLFFQVTLLPAFVFALDPYVLNKHLFLPSGTSLEMDKGDISVVHSVSKWNSESNQEGAFYNRPKSEVDKFYDEHAKNWSSDPAVREKLEQMPVKNYEVISIEKERGVPKAFTTSDGLKFATVEVDKNGITTATKCHKRIKYSSTVKNYRFTDCVTVTKEFCEIVEKTFEGRLEKAFSDINKCIDDISSITSKLKEGEGLFRDSKVVSDLKDANNRNVVRMRGVNDRSVGIAWYSSMQGAGILQSSRNSIANSIDNNLDLAESFKKSNLLMKTIEECQNMSNDFSKSPEVKITRGVGAPDSKSTKR